MRCLNCSDCCIRFEIPEINKRAGQRCQYLNGMNLCDLWDKPERPKACNNHGYPASICPIGIKSFTKEEAKLYEESLFSLFTKTGRTLDDLINTEKVKPDLITRKVILESEDN